MKTISLRVGAPASIARRRRWQRQATPYLFLLPGLSLFALWMIYPLFKALQISLYDWQIMPGVRSPFVGLDNYTRALRDPTFWLALRNTFLYALVTVPAQLGLALAAALLLDGVRRGKVLLRTLYYLPVITSWVIVSVLFRYLFQSPVGPLNFLLVDVLGILPAYVPWLQRAHTAVVAIWSLGIWKGIGWSMVVLLAALQTIPGELYEAAAIDGAGRWNVLRRITLPLLRPILVFLTVVLIIGAFNVFISVYLITGGGPMGRTEVMLSYMYRQAFEFLEFGYGAALSWLLALIIFFVSFVQLRFLRRPVEL